MRVEMKVGQMAELMVGSSAVSTVVMTVGQLVGDSGAAMVGSSAE